MTAYITVAAASLQCDRFCVRGRENTIIRTVVTRTHPRADPQP